MDPMLAAGEGKRMLSMLQVARKRKLGNKAKPAMAVNPDELETQPMFQQAGPYICSHKFFASFAKLNLGELY